MSFVKCSVKGTSGASLAHWQHAASILGTNLLRACHALSALACYVQYICGFKHVGFHSSLDVSKHISGLLYSARALHAHNLAACHTLP